MWKTQRLHSVLLAAAVGVLLTGAAPRAARAVQALSTEDFLNTLGVNTHLNGLTQGDPWNTDTAQVASQLNYLGVRLDRDWAWSTGDGQTWKNVQNGWPQGKFWSSIDEASPADQRTHLGYEETIYNTFPGLIYAMGGPNEEDDSYPQQLGARLPDSALVQQSLYGWAHSGGRNVIVSQMEFGAGWTGSNNWQGDYNPTNPGINLTTPQNGDQKYTPGPADLGGAHTYISNTTERPVDVLNSVRELAQLTTPGKPVAHTEMGAYTYTNLSTQVYGQYMVMGALDSASSGDAGYLVYGLQDSGPEQSYGFFTYPGGVAHEAATDYHALTSLLASTSGGYGPGSARTFTPGSLGVSYSNTSSASHLLLEKPTGEYVIADWSEQLMTGSQHTDSDTVNFGQTFGTVSVYDVESGTTPVAVLHNVSSYTLSMNPSDTYLLVLSNNGGSALPDLVVTSVSFSPAAPNVNDHVVFSCVVKNQGNAATPAGIILGVGFSLDGASSPVSWEATDTSSLAPGASVTLTADNGPSGVNYWVATPGSHTVSAYVDDVNRIAESNENNNTLSTSLTVGAIANGTYTLTPGCATGSHLDANGGSVANGTKVQIWQASSAGNQKWTFTNQGNGWYQVHLSYSTAAGLDVNNAGTVNGTLVQLWQSSVTSKQLWKPIPNGNGTYKLTPQCAPGMVLDVNGASATNGTQVQIWQDNGTPAQQWTLGTG